MAKNLPPRPNLDHLRRQAKALLAALEAGDPEAITTIREHLPAAKDLSRDRIRTAGFRLADAQSAVARKTGFASWPRLARHVEQLRSLEGTWAFTSLEIDGCVLPPEGLSASRLLIDGDRFRTESPEATYEGIFNIDVESDPHGIDIEFVAGPEAGNWNYGIFRLDGDRLDLCLDVNGRARPTAFRTVAGSGHAFETLRRASHARPDSVTGGTRTQAGADAGRAASNQGDAPHVALDRSAFAYVPSATLARLQGEWGAEGVVRDGEELPAMMRATGHRSATDNEIKITFGGQLMIHALVRLDESTSPIQIDYHHVGGGATNLVQFGIMEWRGDIACFCMAAPGRPRPCDFDCPPGSGRTLSLWRKKKSGTPR